MGHSWWNISDDDFAFRFDIGHITPSIMRILAQRNAQAKDASLKKIDTHAVLSWWDIDLMAEPSAEMFDEGLDLLEARMTLGEERGRRRRRRMRMGRKMGVKGRGAVGARIRRGRRKGRGGRRREVRRGRGRIRKRRRGKGRGRERQVRLRALRAKGKSVTAGKARENG